MKIAGVVLAAGLGKRMYSSQPKVLHEIHGMPMLQHVLDTLRKLKPERLVIIIGKHAEKIREAVQNTGPVSFAEQQEAKGTADALLRAVPYLRGFQGTVLVVYGDSPLISSATLHKFLLLHRKKQNKISVLSFKANDCCSYGRIIRDHKGFVSSIIEEKDATPDQKAIREVNSGVYAMEPESLHLLKEIKLNKAKGEYYLTDIVRIARDKGVKVEAFCTGSEEEFMGVNTPGELETARQLMKEKILKRWKDRGVHFVDSGTVYLSSRTRIGTGTTIYPNVHLEGSTEVGKRCIICPNVRIQDSVIGDDTVIKDSSLIEGSVVKKKASVGPFAHIRPGSEIGAGAKIGNFVELKKSIIGAGTKASHLTYIGDAMIGKDVNIGAGTITCNYDGHTKHITTIEDRVFIGSDSQLVAPVRIGKGAYVGAGSTITKDVPPRALALSRTKQTNLEDWAAKRQLKGKSEKLKVRKGRKS